MPFRNLPFKAQLYILLSIIVSICLLISGLFGPQVRFDGTLGILLACAALASLSKVDLTVKNGRMNLSNAVIFLAAMLYTGPLAAMLTAAVSGFVGTVFIRQHRSTGASRSRLTWYKPALSIANLVQSAYAAAWVWDHWHGPDNNGPVTLGFLESLLFISAAYFLVNTLGVSAAVTFAQGLRLPTVWRENFLWTFPGYLFAVCASGGAFALYATIRLGAFLVLIPVCFVFYGYKLYLDKINSELRHVQDLNELNGRVISTLAMTIEAKDRYTHKHVERVREYALAVARELGVTGPKLEAVRIGSMVHDIGKIAVPESILTKPGKLTSEEFERMKVHVAVGVKIMEAVNFPFPACDAVACHHERWDGNGYPNGLKGEEIPIVGRIVAIADGFDALTSDRHYRKAMTHEEALELIESQRGQQYDPRCIDALTRAIPKVCPIIEDLDRQQYQADEFAHKRRNIPQEALEEISRAAEEAVVIADMALNSGVSHTPDEIMVRLLDMASHLIPCTLAAVFTVNTETKSVGVRKSCGLFQNLVENLSMNLGEGISGWVAENNAPAMNAPAANDLARRVRPGENLELNSALSVPISSEDVCMGTITLYHTGYNLYNEHHVRLLTTLASHAWIALDTIDQMRRNQVLAHTDVLTGLPNMRSLIRALEDLTREGNEFSILVLDLNGFKQINDTLGHLSGDRALQDVSGVLESTIRAGDMAGRYAGDEFVVICPNTKPDVAQMIGDRINSRCQEISPAPGSQLLISTSVGVAHFPTDGPDWRALIGAADRRMYADKFLYRSMESGIEAPDHALGALAAVA